MVQRHPSFRVVVLASFVALISPAGVAVFTSTVSAQEPPDKTFEQTVDLEPGGHFALHATRGSVQLTSWNEPRVEIRATIAPPSGVDADYARRAVEGTTIDVTTGSRSVSVRSDYDQVPRRDLWGRRVPRIHYEIRAPREIDLDLTIDRSDTLVEGFDGRIDLDLDRSDLEVRDLTGRITLDQDRGGLDASNLSGEIQLDLDRGRRVVLDDVRASLDLDFDRTDVSMHRVWIDDDSRVEIDRGDLRVELDAAQTLTIDAEMSRRADFSSELPISTRRNGHDFQGTLNGGGPRLVIDADRSEIRLATP